MGNFSDQPGPARAMAACSPARPSFFCRIAVIRQNRIVGDALLLKTIRNPRITMKAFHWLLARSFTWVFLALAIVAIIALDYDSKEILLWFLLPFYVISLGAQYVMPKVQQPLEKNELKTDLLSNGVLMVINSLQNNLLALVFTLSSSSLLIHFGWLDPAWGLSNQAMWVQVLVGVL